MNLTTAKCLTRALALPCLLSLLPPLAESGQLPAPGDGPSPEIHSAIRTTHEANRHAVRSTEAGYEAPNPGQRWTARFDGRGFQIVPSSRRWSWGLELEAYGFPGTERTISGKRLAGVEGTRLAYAWDELIEEWYVNDSRGLEHGYIIHRRPAVEEPAANEPLTLTIRVLGELQPILSSDGRDVRFLDSGGTPVLDYSGLTVLDATGRELVARFELVDAGLQLRVQEDGAHYPLMIDPIAQQAYLKAPSTDVNDYFGGSVAASGDTVVVGAYGESSNAVGVNGDHTDNSSPKSGAAYVFKRLGSAWHQEAYLKASNTDPDDFFGLSVAISGDTIVVGAPREDSGANGVNGNQNHNGMSRAGAAYVFVRNAGLLTYAGL